MKKKEQCNCSMIQSKLNSPSIGAITEKKKEGVVMDAIKLVIYGFAILMFLSSVALGLIFLPIAIGILVVMTNLEYLSIDQTSPLKEKVRVAIYVGNFLLIFFLIFNFIVHPIFETIISKL
ncbi:hypothetical protein [Enterococcus avium]|uniref:hypothetical protein n=1 Tax=Enterococcus avium TaxID=33945 RepID=UPI0037B0A7E9